MGIREKIESQGFDPYWKTPGMIETFNKNGLKYEKCPGYVPRKIILFDPRYILSSSLETVLEYFHKSSVFIDYLTKPAGLND